MALILIWIFLFLLIFINLIFSIFAKAHEYKCGYVDRDGVRCDGAPKLGELTQVCIMHVYSNLFIY